MPSGYSLLFSIAIQNSLVHLFMIVICIIFNSRTIQIPIQFTKKKKHYKTYKMIGNHVNNDLSRSSRLKHFESQLIRIDLLGFVFRESFFLSLFLSSAFFYHFPCFVCLVFFLQTYLAVRYLCCAAGLYPSRLLCIFNVRPPLLYNIFTHLVVAPGSLAFKLD